MKEDIRDMNFKADEIGMRIYVQSKIRADGATGSVFRFAEASFDDAVGRVQKSCNETNHVQGCNSRSSA